MSKYFFMYNNHRYNVSDIVQIKEIQKSSAYSNTFFFHLKTRDKDFNITLTSEKNFPKDNFFHSGAIYDENPETTILRIRENLSSLLKELDNETYFIK